MRLDELVRRIHFAYPTRRSASSLAKAKGVGILAVRRDIRFDAIVHI